MNHYARTHIYIYIWRTGRNHRDVKSRATSRAKLCSIGRLASSMKVSDISSMVPTTREHGVFVPSTTGDHLFRSIQDENVGCTHDRQRRRRRRWCSPGWHRRSTSYLIENIIEWRVGKHAIGHAIGDKLREEWTSPFVVSFNPLANEARLQNAIRESGIERERERERERIGVYSKNLPIHDVIRDYEKLEKSKIRHYGSWGSQSRNVASIFEILGNFHIVESHEADSIQFLFGLSPSECIGCSTFSKYLFFLLFFFFFFFEERRIQLVFRVIAPLLPGRETLSGKWIISNLSRYTFKFYNTFREYFDILPPPKIFPREIFQTEWKCRGF